MRLDNLLYKTGYYASRTKASEAVNKGEVLYKGSVIKPSKEVDDLNDITFIKLEKSFVSNGGYKLEKALREYDFDVTNAVFVDVGASNGGFTDCLLQRGAKKVYAVDVGKTQLEAVILNDSKVVVMDNTNARDLQKELFTGDIDGVTCDVSFISLTYIIPSIYKILKDDGIAFLLIKPQFEVGKSFLNKQGIVNNKKARFNAVNKIYEFLISFGFSPQYLTVAPIKPKKNVEFIIVAKKSSKEIKPLLNIVSDSIRGEL